MQTIIVATDFSESSEVALKYASFIAKFTKAKISLLNYYQFSIHVLNARISPTGMSKLVKNNQEHLESYAEAASYRYNIPLTSHTLTSLSEDTLSEFAEKVNASMIVMGRKKDYSAYLSTENVSNTIITNSTVPVLIVPEGVQFNFPEKVLYACDYHSLPHKKHLVNLKEFVSAFESELQILHVCRDHEESDQEFVTRTATLELLENSISTVKHTYKDVESKSIIAGLEKGINEFNADMLIMSPHKYGFWNSLFHKSKTLEMAFKTRIPLLAIPG
ncbi:universal stress protein [Desertivirga brevis]|uniref:universal stress protein n=1 Tax=Desertivirga brevis TaxID=2810310 RepID=UPI001A974E72|nr:universal stress protein [Pedobacter sp. SYSU D00873]